MIGLPSDPAVVRVLAMRKFAAVVNELEHELQVAFTMFAEKLVEAIAKTMPRDG